MSAFSALDIAASGLGVHQTWLDMVAYNIANANTARPTSQSAFQAQMLITAADPGHGVVATGVALSDPAGIVVSSPDHPLADADGNVRMPAMDMASQMSQLIMAQRGFNASSQVTKFAQDTYSAALAIGGR